MLAPRYITCDIHGMNDHTPELTVKEQYDTCKYDECPRLRPLMDEREGKFYFAEGSMAYTAITLCNNWAIGMSDGNCPIKPIESEEQGSIG